MVHENYSFRMKKTEKSIRFPPTKNFFFKASWHPDHDWIAVGVYPPPPPLVEADLVEDYYDGDDDAEAVEDSSPRGNAKVAFFDEMTRTRVTDFFFTGADVANFNVFSRDGMFMLTTGMNSRDPIESEWRDGGALKSQFFPKFFSPIS